MVTAHNHLVKNIVKTSPGFSNMSEFDYFQQKISRQFTCKIAHETGETRQNGGGSYCFTCNIFAKEKGHTVLQHLSKLSGLFQAIGQQIL